MGVGSLGERIVTDNEFLKTSAVRWDVVCLAPNMGQADAIHNALLGHQIPAFIEGLEGSAQNSHPAPMDTGFRIRVPREQVQDAKDTLRSLTRAES